MKHIHIIRATGVFVLLAASAPLNAQGRGSDKGKSGEQHGKAAEQHGKAAEQHGKAAEQHGKAAEQHKTPARATPQRVDAQHAAIQQKQAAQQQAVQQKKMTRISEQEQRRRISEQQQRATQYQSYLVQRTRTLQQQSLVAQQQKRLAQYRAQQVYLANLQAQQARLRTTRDYNSDPYYYSPNTYRYTRSGSTYQTNQYGVAALKRAVNYGYEEGVRFGQADRQDRLTSNYQNSFAYQDANYGYDGLYVTQADYNYYFRQGFQRGYQDGYNSSTQYGSYTNTSASILGTLVNGILGLQLIR